LLLIAVLVIVGLRFYRSTTADDPADATAPPAPVSQAEAPTSQQSEDEPPTPERRLAELATIAVVTEAPGSPVADAPIAAGDDPAVLRQKLQPGELPGLGPAAPPTEAPTAAVAGSITYRGLLHDEVVVPSNDRHVCEEHAAGALRVSDGHLADVLVWVDAGGGEGATEASISVTGCRIGPRATAMRSGGKLTLASADSVEHRIVATHAGGEERLLAALAPGEDAVEVEVEQAGLFRLSCEHHPWEEAHLLVADHPHVSVTDVDGRFHLGGIPLPGSGQVPLRIFHPMLGTFEQTLKLEGPLQLDIDLTERTR